MKYLAVIITVAGLIAFVVSVVIGSVLLALVGVFVTLGGWSLLGGHHAEQS